MELADAEFLHGRQGGEVGDGGGEMLSGEGEGEGDGLGKGRELWVGVGIGGKRDAGVEVAQKR